MNHLLSHEALEKIDKMVERVARKAGYTGKDNMTYREILQMKLEQKRDKMKRRFDKYRRKLSMKAGTSDFAEEIKTYLQDGLIDLMKEGHSEDEAIAMTLEKFDEAELRGGFDDFMEVFGGFGLDEYREISKWYAKNGEAVGLFYAAFIVLGSVLGALCGYVIHHSLVNILIGFIAGLFLGIGLGLFSHAMIALKRRPER